MDKFSAEEINLMCIYDTGSRQNLLADLITGLNGIYDPDMREVFESTTQKLKRLSDEEFSEIGFYAADESFDDGEGSYIAE